VTCHNVLQWVELWKTGDDKLRDVVVLVQNLYKIVFG
jgi:hypothetical protein